MDTKKMLIIDVIDAVWKDETFAEPGTVDVHISRLRTRIEDDPAAPVHIRTYEV